ncbi:FKBP-type peptidyl-prolyl cis-trans isomerase SlyD [Mariprofundus micogutta]|uniref:Peptidyl-prolyl cis-trans isomerase n=1 Tax=Mariprofundus micogutta TaxID=1921010 RepID=A0A1L8CNC4_9PROT|nr:peptidylprolyl isomerase [Mariprofundus micogutta]GAV20422.1 FKBP-type peptidyl-prolyl cis-trans isomerase SlyD [Mariprofundus micogutta]
MQITNHCRVSIHYTLTKPDGDIIESSPDGEPLDYVHGTEALVPGLEKALEGRSAGERIAVSVQPAEGYGERSDQLIQNISRDIFHFDGDIEPGMRFQADTGQGIELVTVINVDENLITIDANHPLAGEILNFTVDIIAVHEASQVVSSASSTA